MVLARKRQPRHKSRFRVAVRTAIEDQGRPDRWIDCVAVWFWLPARSSRARWTYGVAPGRVRPGGFDSRLLHSEGTGGAIRFADRFDCWATDNAWRVKWPNYEPGMGVLGAGFFLAVEPGNQENVYRQGQRFFTTTRFCLPIYSKGIARMLVLSRKRDESIVASTADADHLFAALDRIAKLGGEAGEIAQAAIKSHVPKRQSVTIVDIRGDKVRLGFEFEDSIQIHRREVQEEIDRKASHSIA